MPQDQGLMPYFIEGLVRKEDGMDAALKNADQAWKASFVECVERFAAKRVSFTSEDIIDEVGLQNSIGMNKNNAVGAIMNGCAKRGIIIKTGRHVQSRRPRSNGAEITEWVGR